jgi:HK97 family phage portal protein
MAGTGSRLPDKKVQRPMILAPKTLKRLSQTDAITWAIIRTRRDQVASAKWDIVPKLDNFKQELHKWQDVLFDNLNPWGYKDQIKLKHIPEQIFEQNIGDLRAILSDTIGDKYDKKSRIKWIMQRIKRHVEDDAHKHCSEIKRLFGRPCNETPTFEDMQELIIDDLMVFDAGIIILNNDSVGRMAEMYSIPGEEVYMYRNEDRTIPEPPDFAYLWEQSGQKVAEFTRDELVYIMANPGQNFYGRSPTETAAFIITTSLNADAYNNDYLKFGDVPPGVLNLGKDVNDDQRAAFKTAWEQEKNTKGGIFRVMFTSGSDNVEFIPLRPYSNKDMQLLEYLKWTLSIKCACFQISPQDIGFTMDLHRTTSEVQYQISRDRGIRTLLERLAKTYNTEIIKRRFPSYMDAQFKYLDMDTVDETTRANLAAEQHERGLITLNEAREDTNKRPVPGGDVLLGNRIPGQGFVPVEVLEQEADKYTMLSEIQQSQRDQAALSGQTMNEAEGMQQSPEQQAQQEQSVDQTQQPQQEEKKRVFEVPTDDTQKLQKVFSSLSPGDSASLRFTNPAFSRPMPRFEPYLRSGIDYSNRYGSESQYMSGLKAGMDDYTAQEVANVFSDDPNERTRGIYTIIGIPAGAALATGIYHSRGALAAGVPAAAKFTGKAVGHEMLRAGIKVLNTNIPGKMTTNSKIVGSAINYYRGRMGLKPVRNVHRW